MKLRCSGEAAVPSDAIASQPPAAPAPSPYPAGSPWSRPHGLPPVSQTPADPTVAAATGEPTTAPTTHPYAQQPWATQQIPFGAPIPPSAPSAPAGSGGRAAGMPWRRAVVAVVAAGAIALTAGGVGGFVGYALHGSGSGLQTVSSGSKNAAPIVDRSSLASIAAAIQPDVVVIQTSDGEGSGVVISADGYIVTNNHVVRRRRTTRSR